MMRIEVRPPDGLLAVAHSQDIRTPFERRHNFPGEDAPEGDVDHDLA
jgi:hypothetical protein